MITPREMERLLSRVLEVSLDSGKATGGSQTTVEDTTKNWPVDMFAGSLVNVIIASIEYIRACTSNTADTLTIAALPSGVAPSAGDSYAIRRVITVSDITHWAGTALTGRDISLDLKALIDDSIKGLMRSLGDAGATPANATGNTLLNLLDFLHNQLPAALTAAGHLKSSIEEQAIAVGIDVQARYPLKTIEDLTPGAPGTFWLPAAGDIDLSNFIASSWYIYAPTTATMTVNCYLNISHDAGTTWRRAAGYEILDADFVRDVWNSIHCPLMLAEAKLEVVIGVAAPATLDLMVIRKA